MEYANREVAHRVNDAEQTRGLAILAPESEPREVKGTAVFGTSLVTPTDLLPKLHAVARGLVEIIETERARGQEILLDQARSMPLDELYEAAQKSAPC